jgi:hypothetical protein
MNDVNGQDLRHTAVVVRAKKKCGEFGNATVVDNPYGHLMNLRTILLRCDLWKNCDSRHVF